MNVIVTFAQCCVEPSATMPVSSKLASKELLLDHQIEGFSKTVQSGDCAVARGNGPIHHGNAAKSCVYILIRIARCVKRCCIREVLLNRAHYVSTATVGIRQGTGGEKEIFL